MSRTGVKWRYCPLMTGRVPVEHMMHMDLGGGVTLLGGEAIPSMPARNLTELLRKIRI